MSIAASTPEWLAFLLALVLPDPERREQTRRVSADIPFWSALLGLAEFIGGAVYLVHDGMTFLQGTAERNASAIMANDPTFFGSKENALAYYWSGSFNVLEWLSQPLTPILLTVPVVGMVRLVAFAASREASGEFLVWAFVRLAQLFGRQRRKAADKARFGVRRPDKLVEEPGCDLVLLTSTPQSEWNEYVTVEIGERFYKVTGQEVRRPPGERWSVYAYKLDEEPENAVIRRLLRYEPFLG